LRELDPSSPLADPPISSPTSHHTLRHGPWPCDLGETSWTKPHCINMWAKLHEKLKLLSPPTTRYCQAPREAEALIASGLCNSGRIPGQRDTTPDDRIDMVCEAISQARQTHQDDYDNDGRRAWPHTRHDRPCPRRPRHHRLHSRRSRGREEGRGSRRHCLHLRSVQRLQSPHEPRAAYLSGFKATSTGGSQPSSRHFRCSNSTASRRRLVAGCEKLAARPRRRVLLK